MLYRNTMWFHIFKVHRFKKWENGCCLRCDSSSFLMDLICLFVFFFSTLVLTRILGLFYFDVNKPRSPIMAALYQKSGQTSSWCRLHDHHLLNRCQKSDTWNYEAFEILLKNRCNMARKIVLYIFFFENEICAVEKSTYTPYAVVRSLGEWIILFVRTTPPP